MNIKKYQSLQN